MRHNRTSSSYYSYETEPYNSDMYYYQKRKKRRKKKRLFYAILILILLLICGLIFYIIKKNALTQDSSSSVPTQPSVNDTASEYTTEYVPIDVIPPEQSSDTTYYLYNQLPAEEQRIYDAFLHTLLNAEKLVTIDQVNTERLNEILSMISYDHPEIFWFDGSCQYTTYSDSVEYKFDYLYDNEEIESRKQEIENTAEHFFTTLNSSMSDYEKIKAVYEYLIETIDYTLDAPDNQNIYSSLVNRKTVCAGYTRAFQYLTQRLGFECIYVSGDIIGRGSHAWNIIRCGNKYYQVDVTFGDRAFEDPSASENMPENLKINYSYLCCTDEEIYADRKVTSEYPLPKCSSDDLNYYKQLGCYYDSYSSAVTENFRSAVEREQTYWECQFSNKTAYDECLDAIQENIFSDIVNDYYMNTYDQWIPSCWYSNSDELLTIAYWYETE